MEGSLFTLILDTLLANLKDVFEMALLKNGLCSVPVVSFGGLWRASQSHCKIAKIVMRSQQNHGTEVISC